VSIGNESGDDGVPTCELYFVERTTATKTLNILHQVWRTADGIEYLREVGKLSISAAKDRFKFSRSGSDGRPRSGAHRLPTIRGERLTEPE
jgi:hypothetical protein